MTAVLRRASTLLVGLTVGLGLSSTPTSASDEPVLVIEGRGDGHGVGMSQDGALAMSRAGDNAATILEKFYPGTSLATAGGLVGVRVLEGDTTRIEVHFPTGGEVRAPLTDPGSPGFPVAIEAGGSVTVTLDKGRFRAEAPPSDEDESAMPPFRLVSDDSESTTTTSTTLTTSTTTTTSVVTGEATTTTGVSDSVAERDPAPGPAPPSTLSTTPAEPPPSTTEASSADGFVLVPADGSTAVVTALGRSYRGVLEVESSDVGGILLVNRLDVEEYLKGMGEVLDPSWPPAALQTQAVAARTYALRAVRTGGTICDDDRCQVYLGAQVEYPAMNKAVDDTTGRVLTFDGGLASTVYSASAGGVTALPSEGFGTDSSAYPYLPSTPYVTGDPVPWSESISMSDLARLFRYQGHASSATVSSQGPSGRALKVTIDGESGPLVVDGRTFAARLDLQSTLFSLQPGEGAARRSVALPAGRPIQALPDDVAELPPLAVAPVSAHSRSDRGLMSAALLACAAAAAHESRRRRRPR